jgi:hypothetical protein
MNKQGVSFSSWVQVGVRPEAEVVAEEAESAQPIFTPEFLQAFRARFGYEVSQYQDSVEYYNRSALGTDEAMPKTIAGSFYKVRERGGASSWDIGQVSAFYRRCAGSICLAFVHSYFAITFLYDARILTSSTNRLARRLPVMIYSGWLLGSVGFVFWKNH